MSITDDTTATPTEGADESTVDATATEAETPTEGAEDLGDKGKKALDAMKAERNEARKAARELKRQLDELARKPAEEGEQPDLDAIRAEARREALAAANERIIRSEVKATATGKLADPADAYKFLDLSQFEVNDDGSVDADEIADAIDELVKSKPYLAAQGGPRFKGTADGGTRKEARPSQLTKADIARMKAAGQYEAIEQARMDGRLDDLLSGKHS